MFDLQDDEKTKVTKSNAWDRLPIADAEEPVSGSKLDDEEHERLFNRLMAMYQQEIDRQSDNRIQMAIDEDFYDNIQWSEQDAQSLKERGQAPLVYNVIAQSVNWIIGSEKRGRTDFKVLPRGKEDAPSAEKKTQLLKYLSDCNRTPFHRSRAFEDAVKVGIGWLEDGVQDDDDAEPVYSRYENWRNMLWDSAATELDLSDCRYVTRSKWLDLDVAIALFPEREELIRLSAIEDYRGGYDIEHGDEVMDQHEMHRENDGEWRSLGAHARDRVRLIEVWFRKPERVNRIIAGQFRGEVLDEDHPGHMESVAQAESEAGRSIVAQRLMMRVHCAIMTTKGLLHVAPSPYRHNRFPFTPIWGYRRGRDGMPYGVIRGLRDIQEDINKRASKALYILSTNKTVMDEGAVDDVEEFRHEVARPDAVIIKKTGKELALNVDRELASAHLELMARSIAMIQQVGGVTDEMMGRTTNATSGVAVQARQEQGALTTSKLFDNLRFAVQCQGEIQLSLTEQYFTEEKEFRITNDRGTPDYITVNDGLPENDITRTKADFIISEGEWRATLRQAAAEQLMEMMTRLPPEVSMVMLDLVIESMDLPNREELVQRIRRVTGQEDPDADENDPEVVARREAAAQQAQIQQMFLEADLREKLAKAGKTEAEAAKIAHELATKAVSERMGVQKTAIEAARQALEAPLSVDVADGLLREAGFISAPEEAAMQQEAAEQEAAEQEAMQQQAAMEQQAMEQQAAAEQGMEGHPQYQPVP